MNKLVLALVAFFALFCVATATLQQTEMLSLDELVLLQEQIEMGVFSNAELSLISEALEVQEMFLVEQSAAKSGVFAKVKTFFSNTYVQYASLGLATALLVALAVVMTVVIVKKVRKSKQDKQSAASQEEEKGLLQPYDAVV